MQFNLLKNKEKHFNKAVLKRQKSHKKTREKSRGRSMVEMLGVLAIIGVLSIGGIQGYTIAMRKYQANEIVSAMQKYATTLYTSCINAQLNGYLSENGSETENVTFNRGTKNTLVCPDPINYEAAGLGAMPSGVRIYPDHHDKWMIIRTNSGDIVRFFLMFDSQEVFKATMNLIGTNISDNNWGVCEYYQNDGQLGSFYPGLLSFIMN